MPTIPALAVLALVSLPVAAQRVTRTRAVQVPEGPARGAPLRNLGISGSTFQVAGDLVFFLVDERVEGRDLNGDGDQADPVIHIYSVEKGALRNTRMAGLWSATPEGGSAYVVLHVDEGRQGGTDRNGDGDALDYVPHVYDLEADETTNLGVALASFRFFIPWIAGERVLLTVDEANDGGRDHNGDGDATDSVAHVYDFARGELVNLGLAEASSPSAGDALSFVVSEADQGGTDLNGDGDAADGVPFVLGDDGVPISLGVAGWISEIRAGRVWLGVSEAQQGDDLDGDRLLTRTVAHVYDLGTKRLQNLRVGAELGWSVDDAGHFGVALGRASSFSAVFPTTYDAETGHLAPSDLAIGGPQRFGCCVWGTVSDGSFAFLDAGVLRGGKALTLGVFEEFQGQDLNGDGSLDAVVRQRIDLESGAVTNLGRVARPGFRRGPPFAVGSVELMRTYEDGQDRNGDGDTLDFVAEFYDASSETFRSTGLAADDLVFEGRYATFVVPESAQGGRDLNGDGDALDGVLHVYDERADRGFSTGLALYGSYARDGSLSAFRVLESVQGEDLNGDGDLADEFAYVLDLPRAPARR